MFIFFPEAKISWDCTVFLTMTALWIFTPEATFHMKRTVDTKIGGLVVLGKQRGDWWGSLLPRKRTCIPWRMVVGRWNVLLKWPLFRWHVTVRGCSFVGSANEWNATSMLYSPEVHRPSKTRVLTNIVLFFLSREFESSQIGDYYFDGRLEFQDIATGRSTLDSSIIWN